MFSWKDVPPLPTIKIVDPETGKVTYRVAVPIAFRNADWAVNRRIMTWGNVPALPATRTVDPETGAITVSVNVPLHVRRSEPQ